MSRNKDKYDNNNPRRQQTFLTAEDIAAGKKTCWHGVEITGSVRNLSPTLWKFDHLTALYLNDNCLMRLPHQIGQLANLRTLDLSSNKLRSLPAELGELIHLRELLLNNNLLRVLPYELGKLFHLHVLGLHGNPLGKDVMSIYNEPNGTNKLLTYMLDNLSALVVMTTMAGYAMAPGAFDLSTFLLCSAGTTLVSGAANSINQVIETSFDAQMARTRNRVLVKGHLTRLHAVGFALGASSVGVGMLYFGVNELTALLGAANLILYTSIYTPMKRYSILNTWVGSLVGAIPPLMGWAACTGDIGAGAWILAGLLYCWQFPHFNALSWNIRPEYLKAGYKMMANSHPQLCTRVSLRHTGYIAGLSLLAPALDVTNVWFAVESLPLNAYFAYLAWDFHQKADSKSSRKLFRFSLLHLPLLMALFLLNKKHWFSTKDKTQEEQQVVGVSITPEAPVNVETDRKKIDEYLVPNIVAEVTNLGTANGSYKVIEDNLLMNVASVLPKTKQSV